MTDSDRSDSWKPEDGAGYMPTEERSNRNAVPREALEELVEQWRRTSGYDDTVDAPGHQIQLRCADELQEVINDYGDTDE